MVGSSPNTRNDGLSDLDNDDILDQYKVLLGTNPLAADSDGDGFPDKFELLRNANPTNRNWAPQYVESVASGPWNNLST